jgi:hypothetical protein
MRESERGVGKRKENPENSKEIHIFIHMQHPA